MFTHKITHFFIKNYNENKNNYKNRAKTGRKSEKTGQNREKAGQKQGERAKNDAVRFFCAVRIFTRCGFLCGVDFCAVWFFARCGFLRGVVFCAVWIFVRCGFLCGVDFCAVWIFTRCGFLRGVDFLRGAVFYMVQVVLHGAVFCGAGLFVWFGVLLSIFGVGFTEQWCGMEALGRLLGR